MDLSISSLAGALLEGIVAGAVVSVPVALVAAMIRMKRVGFAVAYKKAWLPTFLVVGAFMFVIRVIGP